MEPKLSCCCCCCCLLISRGLIQYTRVKQLFLSSECPVLFYFLRRDNVVISLHSESSFRKEKHTVTVHCYFKYDSLYIKSDFVGPWLRQSQHPMPLSSDLKRSSRFVLTVGQNMTTYLGIVRERCLLCKKVVQFLFIYENDFF